MKVLAISGSPRKGGNSEVLCDEFLKGAAESGHETEKIRLAEKKMDGKENYRIMGSQNMDAESIVKENKILGGNENA